MRAMVSKPERMTHCALLIRRFQRCARVVVPTFVANSGTFVRGFRPLEHGRARRAPAPGSTGFRLMDVSPFDKARILSEALPHMQRYDEQTVVVKYGGHAMGEEAMAREFGRDIVLLEQLAINPVVVHGG